MSTFTLPLNARLLTEEAYTRSGYTFPQTGYIPVTFQVSLGFADVAGAAASASGNLFVIPSGYCIEDITYLGTALWAGTSVGTTGLTVGVGSDATAVISNVALKTGTLYRATDAGTATFGIPLAADTTISYTVSVSATAAQSATMNSLTAGAGRFAITLGVPFDAGTRA